MKPDLRRMFLRHAAFAPSGGAFDEGATDEAVHAAVSNPLAALAIAGGRGTLVLYGQTGSGKTRTLSRLHELIARQIFADGGLAVEVRAIEVMGKSVRDLAGHQSPCLVHQTANGAAEVRGASTYLAADAASLAAHLARCLGARSTQSTSANRTSSRSHALISLTIGTRTSESGVLTLLDCAGSEWAADSSTHDAARRREGAEINASLHALKNCVRAQAQKERLAARGAAKGASGVRVPYRDALLTRLLRDCFEPPAPSPTVQPARPAAPPPAIPTPGSGSLLPARRIAIIGCVSPGAADTEHSTSTLRTVMELAATAGDECVTSTQDVQRLKQANDQQPPVALT